MIPRHKEQIEEEHTPSLAEVSLRQLYYQQFNFPF